MAGIYVLFGTIMLFATAIVVWDFVAERVNRRVHRH